MSTPLEHDYIGLSERLLLERTVSDNVVNLKETELRLGLPGSEKDLEDKNADGYNHIPLKNFVSGAKRGFSDAIYATREVGHATTKPVEEKKTTPANEHSNAPASKAQVVGWPPIRSFRKNTLATNVSKNTDVEGKSGLGCLYVKVSMDGAPYLRKVDLRTYSDYEQLSSALEKMFTCFTIGQCTSPGISGKEGFSESCLMNLLHGSEYVLTYEDKDGDWMLVGDVPWEMFMDSCKRLRIMRSTDATGLAPKSTQKSKKEN